MRAGLVVESTCSAALQLIWAENTFVYAATGHP
ncbi:MAG: hypothetical protein ACI875_002444, partial [Planctomycetota bacterium]